MAPTEGSYVKLSPLDRLIAWISPQWALHRLRARRMLEVIRKGAPDHPQPQSHGDGGGWLPFNDVFPSGLANCRARPAGSYLLTAGRALGLTRRRG